MLIIEGGAVVGNSAPNIYADMKPWLHECGAAWWILQADGASFVDADGQAYILHRRSQTELEATPEYQAWQMINLPPCIYAAVEMSENRMNADDSQALIDFEAHLKAHPDDIQDLPITQAWFIKLRHESGQTDVFQAAFVDGACAYTYRYRTGYPLGDWYLSEDDLEASVGGQTYRVKLIDPVKFTVYRLL